MSENRILIKEVSGNCRFLREVGSLSLAHLFALNEVGNYCSANGWKKITNNQCKSCNKAKYVGITREQFIMVVAKAICRTDGDDCETCGFNGNEKRLQAIFGNWKLHHSGQSGIERTFGGKQWQIN